MTTTEQTWDYPFGADGLLNVDEACDLLAVSRDTLDRRLNEGVLRKGKDPVGGRVKIDRRSVMDYLRRMEM